MKVYLHSDDIAATEAVTRAILDRWIHGYLDGFSVIANGEACESTMSALAARGDHPARVVVHLNLSEGPSTLSPEQVPLLVDERGLLKHGFASLAKIWLTGSTKVRRDLQDQIRNEWRAQILRVRALAGQRPLHGVDGHVHVHMLPFLFPIAARLASENGIPEIRISREPFFVCEGAKDLLSPHFWVNVLKHIVLRVCAGRARTAFRETGLASSSYIIGVLYSGSMSAAAASAGLAAAQRKGAESVEVIFHAGRASDKERSRWGDRGGYADFYCSPLRDREFREVALLHADLVQRGLRLGRGSDA